MSDVVEVRTVADEPGVGMGDHCGSALCTGSLTHEVLVAVGETDIAKQPVDACGCTCLPCTRLSIACGVRAPFTTDAQRELFTPHDLAQDVGR